MKSGHIQNRVPSTDTMRLWNVVVSSDCGIKTGIANTLLDVENIAFSFLDESRASFLTWCSYHDRCADKDAFFDFIDTCKSEFEQVHIEIMEVPLPDILVGKVCATNLVNFAAARPSDNEAAECLVSAAHPMSPQIWGGSNVIPFSPPRDQDALQLDQAIEVASDGECSEPERNDAIQAIIDLALARPQTPVGRRAAEWASFWLYG